MEAPRDSLSFLQSTLDALSTHVVILDEPGVIGAVNNAWRQFAARNPGANTYCGLGRNYLQTCRSAAGENADVPRAIAAGLVEVRDGQRDEFRLEYPLRTGTRRSWFELRITRFEMNDAVYLVVAQDDVTAIKRTEQALRHSEERYRKLVEHCPDAIIVHRDGRFVFVNEAGLRLLGAQSRQELLGKEILDFVHPDYRRLVRKRIRRFARAKTLTPVIEEKLIRRDGTELHVEVAGTPCVYDDQPAVQVIVRDISRRKKLEEQLLHSQRMEALGRLAGGVAHDFNNLLTAIRGYADALTPLLRGNAPALDRTEQIRRTAERTAALTGQLLAFGRKQPFQPKLLDLNAVLEDVNDLLLRIIGDEVRIELRPAPEPGCVWADPGQLEQVIMNLVVNARDAMPHGGTLTIETANVTLAADDFPPDVAARPGPYVLLAIRDTGCGIGAEHLGHIFEPFFTTKERQKGTGLGLSTVYGIVRQSGGLTRVDSEPGRGTTFRIYLPQVVQRREPDRPPPAPAPPSPGTRTILVVEDEPEIRQIVCETLTAEGYGVLSAADGDEALRFLERRDRRIDLLITDVRLPGVGGRAVAQRLSDEHPALRILFMSGCIDDAAAQEIVTRGGIDFLGKPFTPAALLQKVRELLATAGASEMRANSRAPLRRAPFARARRG